MKNHCINCPLSGLSRKHYSSSQVGEITLTKTTIDILRRLDKVMLLVVLNAL